MSCPFWMALSGSNLENLIPRVGTQTLAIHRHPSLEIPSPFSRQCPPKFLCCCPPSYPLRQYAPSTRCTDSRCWNPVELSLVIKLAKWSIFVRSRVKNLKKSSKFMKRAKNTHTKSSPIYVYGRNIETNFDPVILISSPYLTV